MSLATTRRSGWTLLELIFAIGLLGVVFAKVSLVIQAATKSTQVDSAELILDDHARLVLDRIALAIMGSERETLDPGLSSPVHATDLTYRRSLGVDGEEVVWDDSERISFQGDDSSVLWRKDPDAPGEKRLVWSRHVSEFLDGEIPNGLDDNGNGLVDEEGLNFVIDGDSVIIRLTVRRPSGDGDFVVRTLTTRATCRN